MRKSALFGVVPVLLLAGCVAAAPLPDVTVMETVTVRETLPAVTETHETAAATPEATEVPVHEMIDHVMLHCGDKNIEVQVYSDRLEAVIDGHATTLPQAESASGVRYVSGDTTIWNHHEDWSYILNEGAANENWVDCTVN